MLLCCVTALNEKDGTGPLDPNQYRTVKKGEGEFAIIWKMTVNGYPHVSLYPEGGIVSGTYFGQGDTLRREPWGNSQTDQLLHRANIVLDGTTGEVLASLTNVEDTRALYPVLQAQIRELQTQVESLKAQIQELKAARAPAAER